MSTSTGPLSPAAGNALDVDEMDGGGSPTDPDGSAVGSDDLGLATDISDDVPDADEENADVATTGGGTADDPPPGGSPS